MCDASTGGMKPYLLAATVALLAVTPVAHAAMAPFEGKIQLRMRDADPQGANYSVRAGRARIDVPSVKGAHDLHFTVDLAGDKGPGPSTVALQRTGNMRTVVGQRCESWRLVEGGDVVDACVVAGAGWYDPRRLMGRDVPAWSRLLEAEHAFPVSVTEVRDGRSVFAMWATDVTREPVSDEVFALAPSRGPVM